MSFPYGGFGPGPFLTAATGSILLNGQFLAATTGNTLLKTTAYNNTSLEGCLQCLHLACVDPTFWHVAGVLPLVAGGFVLTSTTVHAMRLWVMEAFSIIKRRK
jgi:hypothetical protein